MTLIVYERIGFWMNMCRNNLPNSQIIVQKDRIVFLQLIATTNLCCFTTDAPENTSIANQRVRVPIVDVEAHATFFLVVPDDAPVRVHAIMDWVAAADDR